MQFEHLPEGVQEALREKFRAEQRIAFADMEPEMWRVFLDDPEVHRLWEEFRSNAWDEWMYSCWTDNTDEWDEFLERALQYNTNNPVVMHVVSGTGSTPA